MIFDAHPAPYPIRMLRAYCWRVVDGDTYYIEADLGFHVSVTVAIRLRLVDTPELDTQEGKDARAYVQQLIDHQYVMLIPYKDKQSFARWIGDIQYLDPKTGAWFDLAAHLVDMGFAKWM